MAVAQTLTSTADVSLVLSILKPVLEIAEALLGGELLGVLFTVMLRFFKVQSNRMVLAIAFVLVTSAVANALNISALLTTMAMGAVFANLCKNSSEVMSLCDHVTPPVFMMFFVLSGAGLNLAILPSIGVVGVIYVVLRVMGKMAGAWFGATVMKADHNVRRWLGPALIPQAGVAIGLTVVAQQVVPQYAEVVRAVVLCGTLIYELVGPGVAKWTLQKAGRSSRTITARCGLCGRAGKVRQANTGERKKMKPRQAFDAEREEAAALPRPARPRPGACNGKTPGACTAGRVAGGARKLLMPAALLAGPQNADFWISGAVGLAVSVLVAAFILSGMRALAGLPCSPWRCRLCRRCPRCWNIFLTEEARQPMRRCFWQGRQHSWDYWPVCFSCPVRSGTSVCAGGTEKR